MADSLITLGDQKFRKVNGVWVDQKKTQAPKELISLLDKLSTQEAAATPAGEQKDQKPPLPVLPIVAKDFSTAKLESSIKILTKTIDKLTKTIGTKEKEPQSNKPGESASPAEKVFEPTPIPTLKEAMKLNDKEFLHGTTNKYGETQKLGLLRELKNINPFNWRKDDAMERRRGEIGKNLREYENVLKSNNPKMSQKDIDEKIQSKKLELENPAVAQKIKPESASTPEKAVDKEGNQKAEKAKTENIKSEANRTSSDDKEDARYASQDINTKSTISAVKIVDIDDTVLKRLAELITGKKEDDPENKKEDGAKQVSADDSGSSDGPNIDLDNERKKTNKKNRPPAKKIKSGARDATGRVRYAKGTVDPVTGKKIGGQFIKEAEVEAIKSAEQAAIKKPGLMSRIFGGGAKAAENAAESVAKPGLMSRIFGGGAKAAEKEGVKVAEKEALKIGAKGLLKSGLKKIPGLGILAGGAFAAQRAMSGDFIGAGGELLSGALGSIPVAGTAASLGIDAALAARDMGAFGGVPGESGSSEAARNSPQAVPVANKPPSKFASVAKALGKGALMATPIGLGAMAIGGMMKHKSAELTKPEVTPQTQDLTIANKRAEAAKTQPQMAAGPTIINNNTSAPTNINNSQGIINDRTVGDRGSLNLNTF